MGDSKYSFQYCQKLVVLSADHKSLLLARRQGEADYDATFAFIGGKMETSDESIMDGLRREKNEEIGENARLKVYPLSTYNLLFRKQDGSSMILPHYLAIYDSGKIELNPAEYSEYKWVPIEELDSFEPKIENIPSVVKWAIDISKNLKPADFIQI